MRRFSLLYAALIIASVACSSGNAASSAADSGPKAAAVAAAPAPPAAAAPDSLTQAADRGRILGADSAPVWFVMVSDFQCPFCKAWHDSTYTMIKKNYVDTGKLRMAFINFPLHTNSLAASRTAVDALIAADQQRFQKAGVGGTPTFYIDRATMVGALPPQDFRHVIDSVLAAAAKGK
jgi:protein-disulfide isomerase